MKKNLNEELKDIKYLFTYDRGRVISEQKMFDDDSVDDFKNRSMYNPYYGDEDMEEFDTSMDYDDDQEEFDTSMDDMELDEEMDLPVMLPGTKEKERIKVDPGTKPKKPKTPYSPKPGPKPDPKARKRKGDIPTWLTFDELGIDFE
jgi:hypothetical protein